MRWRTTTILAASLCLGGCSYEYKLLAVGENGLIVFTVDPESQRQPDCLRLIEVISADRIAVTPTTGDDESRTGYGTFWSQSVGYDDACANRFPIKYGAEFKGRLQTDLGLVAAKPLLRDVIYDVDATTGATGYGSGRFIIHKDGRIENLN